MALVLINNCANQNAAQRYLSYCSHDRTIHQQYSVSTRIIYWCLGNEFDIICDYLGVGIGIVVGQRKETKLKKHEVLDGDMGHKLRIYFC